MQINKVSIANKNANPAFSGLTANLGKNVLGLKSVKKFSDAFEYSNFQMSIPSMMCILYGATIVPRFLQATDKHDRREILIRDVTSITAILFFAKALNKGFSRAFTKLSGFALSNKPKGHKTAGFLEKMGHYLNPTTGSDKAINVLNSGELTLKYSKLENYHDGIHGFFKFVEEQDGNIGKVLSANKDVKKYSSEILGKDVLNATSDEIKAAFRKAEGSDALKNIYKVFENPNNTYVRKAKTMNSTFDFLSTVLLVPALMIGIEKFNEHNTKRILAKENAKKEAEADKNTSVKV